MRSAATTFDPPPSRQTSESPSRAWARALERIAPLRHDEAASLSDVVAGLAASGPERLALIEDGSSVTYGELGRRCSQYARWALAAGVLPGDTVCLLMRNCAEYPAIWLGINLIGGVVALVNTGLTGDALAHAVATASPKQLIAGEGFQTRIEAIQGRLPDRCERWATGQARPGWRALDRGRYGGDPLGEQERPHVASRGTALLVYTSGTTGLPKAAKISRYRVLEWSLWFAGIAGIGPQDRLLDCLPMYHSTGGVVAVGAMLASGGSVVVRERFSAGRFWDDVVEQGCTLFLYIGELCRYLVEAPAHPREGDHRLRLCLGNGMRADVWRAFQRRFGSPRILEFYASTEGNVSLYNCEGAPGAIGRVPAYLAHRFPAALIACDPETGSPRRGPDGRCVRCGPDEVGEAIGSVPADGGLGASSFEGYTDAAATEAKMLRDVFREGDAWFRTGDLMRRDAAGFFYFVDRLGDTFRWKGENVSTTQVAEALCACAGVKEAVVYGVEVPGAEGRAGMAAITAGPELDLRSLHACIASSLPRYARPLFIRICSALDVTGTFKHVKGRLQREGYDPGLTGDPLFFDDPAADGFVRLDAALHRLVRGQAIRI